MDRCKCLTPLAAEYIEELAVSPEIVRIVGDISAQHLQAQAQAVYGALGGVSGVLLAKAVGDLARDCTTLFEWVYPDLCVEELDGDFYSWTFGPALAEVVAAGIAAVAGLAETGVLPNGGKLETGEVMEVLEDLARHVDCLAPYLFGGLCRANMVVVCKGVGNVGQCDETAHAARRLQRSLQSICAWALAAVGRIVGYDRLNAEVLWEWAAADPLWVLVLAKGALTLERPPLNPFESPSSSALAVPADLEQMQEAVTVAVLGLAAPAIAFAADLAGGTAEDNEISIAMRCAQMARHRAYLAAEVASSGLLGPLLRIVRAAGGNQPAQLAAFLVAVLQPELEVYPEWANISFTAHYTVSLARHSAADLRSSLGWHADDLWDVLSSVPADGHVPRGFLKDCCNLAYSAPVAPVELACLLRNCLAGADRVESLDVSVVAMLCILAANAELSPSSPATGDGGLAAALRKLPASFASAVAIRCCEWKGLLHAEELTQWLAVLDQSPRTPTLRAAQPPELPLMARLPEVALDPQEVQGSCLRDRLHGAPAELRCALDGRLLVDPVRSPQGYVFERSVLASRLAAGGGLCPITGQPVSLGDCKRDPELRKRATQWVREQRVLHPARPRKLAVATKARVDVACDHEPNYDMPFA